MGLLFCLYSCEKQDGGDGDTQKEDLFNLASEYLTNYNIECQKDFSNRDRMIFIWNK